MKKIFTINDLFTAVSELTGENYSDNCNILLEKDNQDKVWMNFNTSKKQFVINATENAGKNLMEIEYSYNKFSDQMELTYKFQNEFDYEEKCYAYENEILTRLHFLAICEGVINLLKKSGISRE